MLSPHRTVWTITRNDEGHDTVSSSAPIQARGLPGLVAQVAQVAEGANPKAREVTNWDYRRLTYVDLTDAFFDLMSWSITRDCCAKDTVWRVPQSPWVGQDVGTSRYSIAMHQFGRNRSEADIARGPHASCIRPYPFATPK